ncbi:MAG: hypothetical protein IJH36_06180 [Clostridia bacterium]|nr:hypothetical protein [Clostridia bacterium]
MDKRRQVVYTICVCPECALRMTVPRKKNQLREYHHIKDMYCVRCRLVQKFVEHRDTEFMMAV